MKERLISRREILIVGALSLALLIVGTFLDFKISKPLFASGSNNAFNSIIASCGPLISCLIAAWAGACLILLPNKVIWKRILLIIGGLAIFAGATWGNINNVLDMSKYQPLGGDALKYSLIAVFSLGSVAAFLLAFITVKKLDNKVVFKVAFIIFCCFAAYYLLNEFFKYLASRPRPRTLFLYYSKDPILGFKQWFEFVPFRAFKEHPGDLYKSFPSGHVQNAGIMLITVPVLSYLCPKHNNRKIQVILFYAALLFTLIIAFSRVWSGAHFLTDVSFGLLLDIAIIFVIQELFFKYYPKEEKDEK